MTATEAAWEDEATFACLRSSNAHHAIEVDDVQHELPH